LRERANHGSACRRSAKAPAPPNSLPVVVVNGSLLASRHVAARDLDAAAGVG
jgi:hypothetical protein